MGKFIVAILLLSLALVALVVAEPVSSTVISFIEQVKQSVETGSEIPSPRVRQQAPTSEPPSASTDRPSIQREQLLQHALELINRDRAQHGLAAVTLGENNAAQRHAEDMLKNDYMSHWGLDGLKPYMRYTLAGGFNYEGENLHFSRTIWYGSRDPSYRIDPLVGLTKGEESLMTSPGHRRNILKKWHKKVNIGVAYDQDRLALVQQFEGDYIRFSKLPTLENGILSLSGNVTDGFVVEGIQSH